MLPTFCGAVLPARSFFFPCCFLPAALASSCVLSVKLRRSQVMWSHGCPHPTPSSIPSHAGEKPQKPQVLVGHFFLCHKFQPRLFQVFLLPKPLTSDFSGPGAQHVWTLISCPMAPNPCRTLALPLLVMPVSIQVPQSILPAATCRRRGGSGRVLAARSRVGTPGCSWVAARSRSALCMAVSLSPTRSPGSGAGDAAVSVWGCFTC